MIDPNTGILTFASGATVKKNDTMEYVQSLNLGEDLHISEITSGETKLSIWNIEYDSKYFRIRFYFRENLLKGLTLDFQNIRYSWDDVKPWPDAAGVLAEQKLAAVYYEWLMNELGRVGEFEWGYANAAYDSRGAVSQVVINYDSPKPKEQIFEHDTRSMKLPDGNLIKCNDSLEYVYSLNLGQKQTVLQRENNWSKIAVKNIFLTGKYFNIDFVFNQNKLKQLKIIFQDSPYDLSLPDTWDEFFPESKYNRKKVYKEWMIEEFGHVGYNDVKADPEADGSYIFIWYKGCKN